MSDEEVGMHAADPSYDPRSFSALTFWDAVPGFRDQTSTPRAYLEGCLETIEAREPVVRAWQSLRIEEARTEADASAGRYRAGTALSRIDGMPIGIKDLISTKDLPTTLGLRDNEARNGIDSASIQALRAAGAIILGKVTTTPLGLLENSVTTNPFDRGRTPGGSSSGSGAAVGARMVPATLGSQVAGSLIRPASYSGNFAIRPTVGGLHRGDRLGYSQAVIGVHAGSLADMWHVAMETAKRSGGDPGYAGLFGGDDLPHPRRPNRLIVVRPEAWTLVDDATLQTFEELLARLRDAGVSLVDRRGDRLVEYFEKGQIDDHVLNADISAFENRWSFENMMLTMPEKLSPVAQQALARGQRMTVEDYRLAILRREEMRLRFRALASIADGLVTLSAPGPAPPFTAPQNPDHRVPYGTPGSARLNIAASLLGAPAVNLPLMAVDGMPVGLQLIGQQNTDEHLVGVGRWIVDTILPGRG